MDSEALPIAFQTRLQEESGGSKKCREQEVFQQNQQLTI
jgi:hypothetical protein